MISQPLPRLLACMSFAVIATALMADESPVDFARDIQPVLRKNCTACHNVKKPEGGLNLDSFAAMMKGGDGGPAIVAKNIETSQIIERIVADDDSIMPPADNTVGAVRLTAPQVEMFKQWILQGAADSTSAAGPLAWNEQVNQLRPIYRVAVGTDGLTTVFGSGSHVSVLGPSLGPEKLVELIDPALQGDPRAHEDFVQSIAISNDSQMIATGGYRTVNIWKKLHRTSSTLSGLSGLRTLTSFSADGKRLAYANDRGRLVIVDIVSGRVVELLKAHAHPLTSIAWIDNMVLSCDESGAIRQTDGQTFASQAVKSDGVPRINGWTRWQGQRLCGTTADGSLAVLDLGATDNQPSMTFAAKPLPARVSLITTSPDPTRPQLAAALENGQAWLWGNTLDAEPKKIATGAPVRTLAISPAGDRLLTTADSQPPKLWSTADGKLVAELRRDLSQTLQLEFAQANVVRQQGRVDRMKAQLPTVQEALKKEEAAKAKVTEARTKAADALTAVTKELETANTAVTAAENEVKQAEQAIAEAMKRMQAAQKLVEDKKKAMTAVVTKRNGAVKELAKRDQALATVTSSTQRAAEAIPALQARIDAETATLTELTTRSQTAEAAVIPATPSSATFDSTGELVVVGSADKTVRSFIANSGLPASVMQGTGSTIAMLPLPNGNLASITDQGECLESTLSPSWQLVRKIGSADESPFVHRVTAIDFSPDNQTLAVGGGEPSRSGEILLINVSTGEVIKKLDATHSDTVVDVDFSPSGRLLASAGADNLGRVFDLASGQQVQSLEGHTHHVLGIAWRNDEQALATAGADRTVKVWDPETGTARRTIGGFPNEVTDIGFVGTTAEVMSSVADGSVRRHNTDNGQQVRVYGGASQALFGMGLSTKTDVVVAGGQAGTIWAWRLGSGEQYAHFPKTP